MKNKGFTLIELLVVISIIGVLSTIVLSSLGTARDKAKDAAIKSALTSMRAQAELQYFENNDYSTVCDSGTKGRELFEDAFLRAGASGINSMCMDEDGIAYHTTPHDLPLLQNNLGGPGANGNLWAATVKLNDSGWFCVDSSGAAKITSNRPLNGTNPPDRTC